MSIKYIWTDGTNEDFIKFSFSMEEYYNQMVGGSENRKNFIPYNSLSDIHNVIMAYDEEIPVACAAFKQYNKEDAEIKRVWVEKKYRGQHISKNMMDLIEKRAKELGFKRTILQTREKCVDAVGLYTVIGYNKIKNYPPYDKMELAVCYAKKL